MRPHLHIGRDRAAGATSTWDATLGLGELSPRIRALLIFIIAAALSGLLLIIADSRPVRSQAVRLVTVDVNIVAQGYRIILSVGDQWSDLNGDPKAEVSVKVPNPFYFLP